MQKTLQRRAGATGAGLFTGEAASIALSPLPVGSGIVFERVDLPGRPRIPACLSSVKEVLRSTALFACDAGVGLVEHLLSALSAYGIDHALVEISGPEVPIFDGSANRFAELIEEAGIEELEAPKEYLVPEAPVSWSKGDVHLVALPSETFRVSYTLHYPHSLLLASQFYSCEVEKNLYRRDIAPCRTFALYEEVTALVDKGLMKGGSLDNGLVIQGDRLLNPEGARFPDEMVRHKVLDLIGDLSLLGKPLRAHVIAVRSGHASNIALARTIEQHLQALHG